LNDGENFVHDNPEKEIYLFQMKCYFSFYFLNKALFFFSNTTFNFVLIDLMSKLLSTLILNKQLYD